MNPFMVLDIYTTECSKIKISVKETLILTYFTSQFFFNLFGISGSVSFV